MDRPVPEGVTIHDVPFSLMGAMTLLPDYKEGDWVKYGGMLYKPEGTSGLMVYTQGDYASGGGRTWTGVSGVTKHYASVHKNLFYCS